MGYRHDHKIIKKVMSQLMQAMRSVQT